MKSYLQPLEPKFSTDLVERLSEMTAKELEDFVLAEFPTLHTKLYRDYKLRDNGRSRPTMLVSCVAPGLLESSLLRHSA